MSLYVVLIGLAGHVDLGERMEADIARRLVAIHDLLFSFGPAWCGSQSTVLLKSDLTHEQIVKQVSTVVGEADLAGVFEISIRSQTLIGWNPDEDGFSALLTNTDKKQ